MQAPDLYLNFIKPLNRLNIPYMVTGSSAAMMYRIPRMTHDIDLVVQLELSNIESLIDEELIGAAKKNVVNLIKKPEN